MRKLLVSTLVLLVAAAVSVSAIDLSTYQAPAPATIFTATTLFPTKATAVTADHLAFLDALPTFSVGVIAALEKLLPITSWDQFIGVKYVSISRERNAEGVVEWVYGTKERTLLTKSRAAILWLFFDLTGTFPIKAGESA